ncbi:hypothetical protein EJ02DRAFT_110958 [Clathrospora elynae]|uniref:Uncharacterized protein n=1 Tax=Clathrospora elynae TaxID=706981 RepID=A0A6A5S777_9PLEO|nr:hypothetical protein EJ02DRAFT_110958 [Clathrospora elynae]
MHQAGEIGLWQRTSASFGGLRDWGPCHLTKENFCRCNRVRLTARWRKDTGEHTLSLGGTRHSICDAVDVKGNFLGTAPTELRRPPRVSTQRGLRHERRVFYFFLRPVLVC